MARTMFLAIGLMLALSAQAGHEPKTIQLAVSKDLVANIRALQKAEMSAVLVLSGGARYEGKIADVGNETVLVTELAGREFYAALVRLSDVVAVEARARNR